MLSPESRFLHTVLFQLIVTILCGEVPSGPHLSWWFDSLLHVTFLRQCCWWRSRISHDCLEMMRPWMSCAGPGTMHDLLAMARIMLGSKLHAVKLRLSLLYVPLWCRSGRLLASWNCDSLHCPRMVIHCLSASDLFVFVLCSAVISVILICIVPTHSHIMFEISNMSKLKGLSN